MDWTRITDNKTQLLSLIFGNELLFVYEDDDSNQLEIWHVLWSPGVRLDYFNLPHSRTQPLLDLLHIFVQTRYSLWPSNRAKPAGIEKVQIHDFGLFSPAFRHTELITHTSLNITNMYSHQKSQIIILPYSVLTIGFPLHNSFSSYHMNRLCWNVLDFL